MSATRNVSQWWELVAKMVTEAETRDQELKQKDTTKLTGEDELKLAEIKDEKSAYRVALQTYKAMAEQGIKLERDTNFVTPAGIIEQLGNDNFVEWKKDDLKIDNAYPRIQKITGPLSLELAVEYNALQKLFVLGETDPKAFFLGKAMKGKKVYEKMKAKADALAAAIAAYKPPVNAAQKEQAAPPVITADATTSVEEKKNEVAPEATTTADISAALVAAQSPVVEEEKSAPAPTVELPNDDEQIKSLNKLKEHCEKYNFFEPFKNLALNSKGEPDVHFQYSEIVEHVRPKGTDAWDDLQEKYIKKLFSWPGSKVKEENALLFEIWEAELKYHKGEMYKLRDELKDKSNGSININVGSVTAIKEINKAIHAFIQNSVETARKAAGEAKQKAAEAKQAKEAAQLSAIHAHEVAETKRRTEENAAEEKRRTEEAEKKLIERIENEAKNVAKKRADRDEPKEMQLTQFYGYVARLLNENKISHSIEIPKGGVRNELEGTGSKMDPYKAKQATFTEGDKETKIAPGNLNVENIKKYMQRYRAEIKNMTKAKLDFLILLEGMHASIDSKDQKKARDKAKIKEAIENINEGFRVNFQQSLTDMLQTKVIPNLLKPATHYVFFSAAGPLRDLTNALNRLVKEEQKELDAVKPKNAEKKRVA